MYSKEGSIFHHTPWLFGPQTRTNALPNDSEANVMAEVCTYLRDEQQVEIKKRMCVDGRECTTVSSLLKVETLHEINSGTRRILLRSETRKSAS